MGHDCDDQETEATKKLLGVDKQDDIKILEEYLSYIKNFDNSSEFIPALENLIKRYKELEEENKEYEATLDIFDEREYRKRYLEERRTEEPNLLYPDADEIYKKYYQQKELIFLLVNEKKELERMLFENNADYIPKSKIKEKIKELQKRNNNENNEMVICTNIMKMQVLQELLEESEENK